MRTAIAFAAVAMFATVTPTARYDYIWPGHGTIRFDVPFNWSLTGLQAGDVGFNFKAVPKSGAAGLVQITLANLPPEKPMQGADLPTQLLNMVQPYVTGSVEGKFSPQSLKMLQGSGLYTQFTDPSLVGKPPVAGDYKVMRNALLLLDEHALAVVTMQFDDAKGSEAGEMLKLVSSMRFERGTSDPPRADAISVQRYKDTFEISMPQSNVTLIMPQSDLVPEAMRAGGATNSPRYFQLASPRSGVMLSGWFESGERFKGIKDFWAGESQALTKGGFSAPRNVAFLKSGDWTVVAYEMTLPGSDMSNVHLRAELVEAGTWIDLHYSITSDLSPEAARERLLAMVRANRIRD